MAKLVKSKKAGIQTAEQSAVKLENIEEVTQSAGEAVSTPFTAVDSLHEQVISGMLQRTDAQAQVAANVATNLPATYLGRFAHHLGASEVASPDGFLADFFAACQIPGTVRSEVAVGVQSAIAGNSEVDA